MPASNRNATTGVSTPVNSGEVSTKAYVDSKVLSGPQGVSGFQGTTGSTGSTGVQGSTGFQGPEDDPTTNTVWLKEEFINIPATSTIMMPLVITNDLASGTGAGISNLASGCGIEQYTTGTTTTGSSGFRSNSNSKGISVGNATLSWACRVRLSSAVSDGTNTYSFLIGLSSQGASDPPSDGILFYYTHSVNSGNWSVKTINSGASTTTQDTGVSCALNAWHILKFVVNAAGTSIGFYVDGTLTNTITTNIPTTNIGPWCLLKKSAGTTARTFDVDYAAIGFGSSRS